MPDVIDQRTVEGFAERILNATLGSLELQAMYLGEKLGWYRALAQRGPLNARELAAGSGTAQRYAREWLEQQAATGYLDVVPGPSSDGGGPEDPDERRFSLPASAAEVLTEIDSPAYLAPLSWLMAATSGALPDLLAAYRTGGGVSWQRLGADARQAQAALNRPVFLHQLTQQLLPASPEVHARLRAGGRAADIGCGEGWSAIGLALGYPGLSVHGFDIDPASVQAANQHAAEAGVADRVQVFEVDAAGAGRPDAAGESGSYDAVFAFECVHDLPDPVAVLSAMRRLAMPGAPVVVMDERTEEAFGTPASATEQLFYGFSVVCCLADGMSHPDSAATGTVMRPATLRRYAQQAGFADAEELPVEHQMFRFYLLS